MDFRDGWTFPMHTFGARLPHRATSLDMGAQRSARAELKSTRKEMENEILSISVSESEVI